MKEQAIQASIKNYLEKEHNAYVVKVISASKAGVPDLIACISGRFVAFEVKTPNTYANVSRLQLHNLSSIRKSKGEAFVVCSVKEVKEIIRKVIHVKENAK